jgi:predicted membrane protein
MARTNVLGFAAVNINFLLEKINFYSHNKMALEILGQFLLDWRSSICMIMNVMFTPATANGYSHVALLPHCFFSSL